MLRSSVRLTGIRDYLLGQDRIFRFLEIGLVVLLAIVLARLAVSILALRGDTAGILQPVQDSSAPVLARRSAGGPGNVPGVSGPGLELKSLFGVPAEPGAVPDARDRDEIAETRLNLKLKGVLVNHITGKRLALIAGASRQEEIYRIGDEIEGAQIVRIETGRVVLRHGGNTEALYLEIPKVDEGQVDRTIGNAAVGGFGIRKVSDTERVIPRQSLRRELDNLPRLLQQAKAVPHTVNGRAAGFKMVDIQSGSVFEDIGLKREDIIQSVNGAPIRTPEDALKAYRELRTSKSFKVGLLRSGRPVTLTLSVQ